MIVMEKKGCKELKIIAILTLIPTAPFHFDGTVFNPSHFPSNDYRWEPGSYWQTLRWKGKTYGFRLRDMGSIEQPKVELAVFAKEEPSKTTVKEIAEEVRWRFDLDSIGVPEFVRRFQQDEYLGPAIQRRPGMRPKSGCSLYEFLVITVVLQNTVVRRSVAMLQALFERYGELVSFDEQKLWAFWDPESIAQAPEDELRALKLGYRAKTLKKQAEQFVHGGINELALRKIHGKEVVAKKLDEIYGVGPQSAWYMLHEHFHFYDALEYISPWECKIVGKLLYGQEVPPENLQRLFTERYGEFRALAFYYLMTDLFWQHREQPVPWLAELLRF
jgi:3-methyladenine DNA glycosylase/8-oxoguanine DNA glycosylase